MNFTFFDLYANYLLRSCTIVTSSNMAAWTLCSLLLPLRNTSEIY